jgi:hypothetical protein
MLKVASLKKKRKVLTLHQKRSILLGLENETVTVDQMGKAYEVDPSGIYKFQKHSEGIRSAAKGPSTNIKKTLRDHPHSVLEKTLYDWILSER